MTVGALAVDGGGYVVSDAAAQQQREYRQGGGLLQFLFQRPEPRQPARIAPREAPRRAARPRARRAAPRQPATPPAPIVEKAPDAKRVLVVGDFLAGKLADGLEAAYAENAGTLIVERANGSSGLVRDDFYDWPGEIDAILEEVDPDVAVVMIGSNDRQEMVIDGGREEVRSEPWLAEYERRVTELAEAVTEKELPLVWVGNLPFRSDRMSSDMIAFNDVYRRVVEKVGGEFVDVWDGFVDENGKFVENGPDMNGQPAQLRSSDGINVTSRGARKIAFYVEKPLNRILQGAAGADDIARLTPGAPGGPGGPTPPKEIDRTVPIAIDDPALDGGVTLLGATVTPGKGKQETAAEKLAGEGVGPEPRPGRADYFSLRPPPPQKERETPPAVATDPRRTTAVSP
jgi:hypothetical protein